MKDATGRTDRIPAAVGVGDLPADEFAQMLVCEKYVGNISFEWERRWHPQIVSLEAVLPSLNEWV